jgi:hypothetical protein
VDQLGVHQPVQTQLEGHQLEGHQPVQTQDVVK